MTWLTWWTKASGLFSLMPISATSPASILVLLVSSHNVHATCTLLWTILFMALMMLPNPMHQWKQCSLAMPLTASCIGSFLPIPPVGVSFCWRLIWKMVSTALMFALTAHLSWALCFLVLQVNHPWSPFLYGFPWVGKTHHPFSLQQWKLLQTSQTCISFSMFKLCHIPWMLLPTHAHPNTFHLQLNLTCQ